MAAGFWRGAGFSPGGFLSPGGGAEVLYDISTAGAWAAWFDATTGVSSTGGSPDKVTDWADRLNSHTMSQSTDGSRPYKVTEVVSGKIGIQLNDGASAGKQLIATSGSAVTLFKNITGVCTVMAGVLSAYPSTNRNYISGNQNVTGTRFSVGINASGKVESKKKDGTDDGGAAGGPYTCNLTVPLNQVVILVAYHDFPRQRLYYTFHDATRPFDWMHVQEWTKNDTQTISQNGGINNSDDQRWVRGIWDLGLLGSTRGAVDSFPNTNGAQVAIGTTAGFFGLTVLDLVIGQNQMSITDILGAIDHLSRKNSVQRITIPSRTIVCDGESTSIGRKYSISQSFQDVTLTVASSTITAASWPTGSAGLVDGAIVKVYGGVTDPTFSTAQDRYYFQNLTSTTGSMHATYADAIASINAVTCSTVGSGTLEMVRVDQTFTITEMDVVNHTIQVSNMFFQPGQEIRFEAQTGGSVPTCLTGSTFYVGYYNRLKFTVHTSAADALAGINKVALSTSGGSGTIMAYCPGHTIARPASNHFEHMLALSSNYNNIHYITAGVGGQGINSRHDDMRNYFDVNVLMPGKAVLDVKLGVADLSTNPPANVSITAYDLTNDTVTVTDSSSVPAITHGGCFLLEKGTTLPTSTPQVATGTLYYGTKSGSGSSVKVRLHESRTHAIGTGVPSANINTTTDRITLPSHGLTNAQPVSFYPASSSSSTSAYGLTMNQVYFIKAIDANTIEVYTDAGLTILVNLTSGTIILGLVTNWIDLTVAGTGTNKLSMVPSKATTPDHTTDTFTVDNTDGNIRTGDIVYLSVASTPGGMSIGANTWTVDQAFHANINGTTGSATLKLYDSKANAIAGGSTGQLTFTSNGTSVNVINAQPSAETLRDKMLTYMNGSNNQAPGSALHTQGRYKALKADGITRVWHGIWVEAVLATGNTNDVLGSCYAQRLENDWLDGTLASNGGIHFTNSRKWWLDPSKTHRTAFKDRNGVAAYTVGNGSNPELFGTDGIHPTGRFSSTDISDNGFKTIGANMQADLDTVLGLMA